MNQSWSIGIICFNEKGTIRQVFEDVKELLEEFDAKYEILLVDDASTDGSKRIIEELAENSKNVRTFLHSTNLGIGGSIRDVYFNATNENIVFVPGDAQFDVQELLPYKNFSKNEFISFYRKENQTYSVFRNLLSFLNRYFNKQLIGLDLIDVNWVKVYKNSILKTLDLRSKSSIIESEICAKLNKLEIRPIQVESKYLERVYGESQGASIKNIVRVIRELLGLWLIVRAFSTFKNKKSNVQQSYD